MRDRQHALEQVRAERERVLAQLVGGSSV